MIPKAWVVWCCRGKYEPMRFHGLTMLLCCFPKKKKSPFPSQCREKGLFSLILR